MVQICIKHLISYDNVYIYLKTNENNTSIPSFINFTSKILDRVVYILIVFLFQVSSQLSPIYHLYYLCLEMAFDGHYWLSFILAFILLNSKNLMLIQLEFLSLFSCLARFSFQNKQYFGLCLSFPHVPNLGCSLVINIAPRLFQSQFKKKT